MPGAPARPRGSAGRGRARAPPTPEHGGAPTFSGGIATQTIDVRSNDSSQTNALAIVSTSRADRRAAYASSSAAVGPYAIMMHPAAIITVILAYWGERALDRIPRSG